MNYQHRQALATMLSGMFWALLWQDDLDEAKGWWWFVVVTFFIAGLITAWIGHLRFTTRH